MPLIHFDGFDDVASATDLTNKGYTNVTGSYAGPFSNRHGNPVGAFGSWGIGNSFGSGTGFRRVLPAQYTDIIVGFAFFHQWYSGAVNSINSIFQLYGSDEFFHLRGTKNGNNTNAGLLISARKTSGNILIAENTLIPLEYQTWYYIEVRLRTTPGSEYLEIRVNGNQFITATGFSLDRTFVDQVGWVGVGNTDNSGNRVFCYDDIYIINNSDSLGFLGNVRIPYIPPNADTVQKDFVPNSGIINYTQVDETSTTDGDTTYVASSTPGARDLLDLSSLPAYTRTAIAGIKPSVAVKTQVDTANIREVIKSGSTITTGASKAVNDVTNYKLYDSLGAIRLNPDTNLPWTEADITNLQIGYEVV